MVTERMHAIELLAAQAAIPTILSSLDILMEDPDTPILSSSSSSSSGSSDDEVEFLDQLQTALQNRYMFPRQRIPRTDALTNLCLTTYRYQHPTEFRRYARMEPSTFDNLLSNLEHAPVFQNDSSNSQQQITVEKQLFVVLVRFGSYGNAASLSKIADMAGVGHGTVDLITRRVVTAIKDSNLKDEYIRWPHGDDREQKKQLVEDQTGLSSLRGGWCMVDGTLIPLFQKPSWYGETFFDRKSRYSMNVQIVNTLDRRIIDYASGLRGSQNDTTSFRETRLAQEHNTLLGPGEWCWGDQGYQLYEWLIIPYGDPLNKIAQNANFNYRLSTVRIRCEHTIGYLKGRFQSLKELRIVIRNQTDFLFATAWINACLIVHSFCLKHETVEDTDFVEDGIAHEREQQNILGPQPVERLAARDRTLTLGRRRREEIKEMLLDEEAN